MRYLAPAFVLAILLVGCAPRNAAYQIRFDRAGTHAKDLTAAAVRVIERQAEQLNQTMLRTQITQTASGAVVRFGLKDPTTLDALTKKLTAPFPFRLSKEVPVPKGEDATDPNNQFADAGITEKHIDWVTAETASDEVHGTVKIGLTPDGEDLLGTIFDQNRGKQIAIFVRGRLMSKKTVMPGDKKGAIQIDNVPTLSIASIFADDVNVGVHATFLPLKAEGKE